MLPVLSPISTDGLTEPTSIAMVAAIESRSIPVPFRPEGIETTYVRQGTGSPPILLLHGFDSSVLEFRRLLPLLAQHAQTWAIDLLGFGFTERPDGLDVSPANIETHLHSFWQTAIQRPVVLVGASMGGAAAISFTLAFPEAVEKLVLIDSAGYGGGPAMGRFLSDSLGNWVTEGFLKKPSVRQKISEKAYFNPTFASPDARTCAALHLDRPNWSKSLISFTRSGGYRSCKARLTEVRVPTSILWGECDRILGTKDAAKFHRAIRQSKLMWVPNCGHVPHLERPDTVAAAIAQFVI
ncbi:alpha/beta fold hydrolase [Altericista sp. CCNU0014]|uniref:alpha/beta fold hydrolase n=1 Tax=Altericista sp. CCNU0014 TaxID=3082949 RepID=UPI00384BFD66